MTDDPAAVAQTLVVDARTAAVVRALRAVGIDPILLKGPSFQQWLYADRPSDRAYGDTDLLVGPSQVRAAEEVLAALGYTSVRQLPGASVPAQPWTRPDHEVDLHHTIWGWGDADLVWRVLQEHTAEMVVGNVRTRVLDDAAKGVHVATHAMQNAFGIAQANEDLTRALAQLTDGQWRQAQQLAREVGAHDAWVLGLQAQEAGRALCRRLGVVAPRTVSPEVELRMAGTHQSGAMGIVRVLTAPTWWGRLSRAARVAFPPREYAQHRVSPGAQAGAGWWLTYPAYWLRLLRRTPGALRAWRQHRLRSATSASRRTSRHS